MAKQVTEIKEFIKLTQRKDANGILYKKNKDNFKFKVRCSKFLYTLVLKDAAKAKRVKDTLVNVKEI